jgi:hypothetical protein
MIVVRPGGDRRGRSPRDGATLGKYRWSASNQMACTLAGLGPRSTGSHRMVDSTSLMSRQNGGLGRLFNQIYVAAAKERQGPGYFDGSERNFRNLFEVAGFEDVETLTETRRLPFPSFDAYFGGVEQGAGNVGQEYVALSEHIRKVVREEARRLVGDTCGPIDIEIETSFASGWR